MRIQHRRYGREKTAAVAPGTTHVIKIGFDAREINPNDKQGKPRKHVFPGKLYGFLICHDSLNGKGNLVVDYDAMESLGEQYTPDNIMKAKKQQLTCDAGLLPLSLRFILTGNMTRANADDEWNSDEILTEEYLLWDGKGLQCKGDGQKASWRMEDGTKKEIDCIPVGRSEYEATSFCKYSVKKECKCHSQIRLQLFYVGDKGVPQPLSSQSQWNALYRLETSSETFSQRALAVLDAAANRLTVPNYADNSNMGWLAGLTGTLTFQKKAKRTGDAKFSKGIVGQVIFQIDERAIQKREDKIEAQNAQLRQNKLEDSQNRMDQLRVENENLRARALALPAPPVPPESPALSEDPEPMDETETQTETVSAPAETVVDLDPEPGPIIDADIVEDEPVAEETPKEEPEPEIPDALKDATIPQMLESLIEWAGEDFKKLTEFKSGAKTYDLKNADHAWMWAITAGKSEEVMAKRGHVVRSICIGHLMNPDSGFTIMPGGDEIKGKEE